MSLTTRLVSRKTLPSRSTIATLHKSNAVIRAPYYSIAPIFPQQMRHFHVSQALLKKAKNNKGGGASGGNSRSSSRSNEEDEDADDDAEDDSPSSVYFAGVELNEAAVGETMKKAIERLQSRLQTVSIRPQPSLLEELAVNADVQVEQEKKRLTGKIKNYGNVVVKNPRLMSVNVFDPNHVGAIDRAIRDSNLGLNPEVQGSLIDVPIPKITQDVKEKYVRMVKDYGEDAKKRIRNIRANIMKTINKEKKSGEKDAAFRSEKNLQNVHDKFIKEIDALTLKKTQELMRG